jgi:HemX protein
MLLQTFHDFSRNALSTEASVALHGAIALYLLASVVALVALNRPQLLHMQWADRVGSLGTLALVIYFLIRVSEAGSAPFRNLFEVIALSALFLALSYVLVSRLRRMPALAVFAYPALTIIFVVSLVFAGTSMEVEPRETASPLLIVHVVLIVLSYALFFMATVSAVMFLMQERALKSHRDPAYIRLFPSLEALRKQMHTCLWLGLPTLTVGFALGFSVVPEWKEILHNLKVITSVVLWLVMLFAVVGRWLGWLHGRRELYVVILGFGLVLLTYVWLGLWTLGS